MTGDLNLMMQLRSQQIKETMIKAFENAGRMDEPNTQAAIDAGRMAELGWLDTEFTMYGCVYLDETLEKRYYKVSTQAEDIYTFIEDSVCNGIYPSNVMHMTKRCAVPSGMKELLAQDIKKELAVKLSEVYSIDFFVELTALAESCVNNNAAELLWEQADALEGVFDEEKLRLFEERVRYAYSCRKLNDASYEKLLTWIKEEYKSMNDMLTQKDIFEKTLYGIAYEDDGVFKYMENAQKNHIYEKMHLIEQEGIFVTPVYSKTYWYNYEYRLVDVKCDFKKELREVCSAEYCEQLKMMRGTVADEIKGNYLAKLQDITEQYGSECAETAKRYFSRWALL